MKITWFGHSGFRIDIGGQVLLIDPWLRGNPVFPADREGEAIAGATAIFLTHGHGDHAGDAARLSAATGAKVHCGHELSGILAAEGAATVGFGIGGTIRLGDVGVSMVPARHSSSVDRNEGAPVYAGGEAGFMIAGEGHTVYVSGDTGIMADMGWMAEYYRPDIGILCAGGHYTMDMAQAAFVTRRFFAFRTVIPCHFGTFPLLAQGAEDLINGVEPNVEVRVPQVMVPMEI